MTFPDFPQSRRHWRFNSTLLADENFLEFMREQITMFFQTNTIEETSSLIIWDALKAFLRGQIISYTANVKKKASVERLEVVRQIKEIDLN